MTFSPLLCSYFFSVQLRSIKFLNEKKIELQREEFAHTHEMSRHFVRARIMLEKTLYRQKAILKERFGTLMSNEQSAARRYELMWFRVPQPIEMRIHLMRCVSNKLRRGNFCILATMYDRLGGHMISWTKFPKGVGIANSDAPFHHKSAATRPIHYSGKYYDRELRFDQSVFALCPAACDVRPSNVIVFELYEMASNTNPRDKVIGWSVLPMVDAHFRIIHGRFRLPFLRGPFDRGIKKYDDVEKRYASDLSLWLSNLYIDIRHLPREIHENGSQSARGEFDIEYDHVNSVLNLGSNERSQAGQREKGGGMKKDQSEAGDEEDTEAKKNNDAGADANDADADADDAEADADQLTSGLDNKAGKEENNDDDDDFSFTKITPVIVNKGINTNFSWWEKAGTIFKKKKTVEDKYRIEEEKEAEEKVRLALSLAYSLDE